MKRFWIKKSIPADLADENMQIVCAVCFKQIHKNCFTKHISQHSLNKDDYCLLFVDNLANKCLCGCNGNVLWRKQENRFYDYLHGHNIKGHTKDSHPLLFNRSNLMKERIKSGLFKRPDEHMTFEQRQLAQRKATQTKIQRDVNRNSWGVRGFFKSKNEKSYRYFSKIEHLRMKQLDADELVVSWERCVDNIEYYDSIKKKNRIYNPDFLVKYYDRTMVEEIKGQITQNVIDKAFAAISFYETQNIDYRILKLQKTQFLEISI